jgi:hypothetical protein
MPIKSRTHNNSSKYKNMNVMALTVMTYLWLNFALVIIYKLSNFTCIGGWAGR